MSATTWSVLTADEQAAICRAVRKALETGGESATFGVVHRLAIGKPRRDVPTHIVQSALETMLADGRVTVSAGPRGVEMWRVVK
jgi:aspartate/methionine/tyrosine aminotransferase